ncbi:MAG TPA: TolC family protein [Myxococcales bacterium]|nr:TolC family protein [Myxococcales bacterium]
MPAGLAVAAVPENSVNQGLPAQLSLPDAEDIFLARGLDLLIAEASVRGAEGDLTAAGAHPNPNFQPSLYYVPSTTKDLLYSNLGNNTAAEVWGLGLALDDNAAIEDELSGKRSLRIEYAAKALAAARINVQDVKRTELSQLRQAYVAAVMAKLNAESARETFTTYDKQLDLSRKQYQAGAIGRLDLSQMATSQLEALQALATAQAGYQQALASLVYLLGVRGARPEVTLTSGIDYRELPEIRGTSFDALVGEAQKNRTDVRIAERNLEQAEVAVRQAKRAVLPDISLNAGYSEICNGATCSSAPGFNFGLSGNLPVLYWQQGEIARAESNVTAAQRTLEKAQAQVLSDVSQAWAGYAAAREQVERMQGQLIAEAKRARDLAQIQYQKGAASLLTFLFAERTYVAAELEYHQDLANYWSSVYQMEQATNAKLH